MKTIRTLIAILIFATSAQARLGEDLGTCMQRYGDPVQTGQPGDPVVFEKAGFSITVDFNSDGIADMISFYRVEGDELTQNEIDHLLSLNLKGPLNSQKVATSTYYETADRTSIAIHSLLENSLLIATKVGMDRFLENEEVAERQSLSGF